MARPKRKVLRMAVWDTSSIATHLRDALLEAVRQNVLLFSGDAKAIRVRLEIES